MTVSPEHASNHEASKHQASKDKASSPQASSPVDPREGIQALLRDLRARPDGLSEEEAARRLVQYGPNALPSRRGLTWPRELARQVTHPLALLLWGAAVLAWLSGTPVLAAAIVGVVLLNAALAFWQEQQAERSVEALSAFLPDRARVLRGGLHVEVDATRLVPGDVAVVEEGAKVPADIRLLEGSVEVDMSALTGESVPVVRTAGTVDRRAALLAVPDAVFRGTACTGGAARGVVFATGAATEIGRIATLSSSVGRRESPLERQVRRVAWLIAAVAIVVGVAFLPLGLLAGLSLPAALTFAVGLLVANVPEGLLPTITLALAAGVRGLARSGAVVKRLSAVETLGSTTVICTDKTGTLTANQMMVQRSWTPLPGVLGLPAMAEALTRCTEATLDDGGGGDATEVALLRFAATIGAGPRTGPDSAEADAAAGGQRVAVHRFDPRLRRMTTVDLVDGRLEVSTKGAPESVLTRCVAMAGPAGTSVPLDRGMVEGQVSALAGQGLRVLAVARRRLDGSADAVDAVAVDADAGDADAGDADAGDAVAGGDGGHPGPGDRDQVERELVLCGLVALLDPPRPSVAPAVRRCHDAGLRVHVISGDNPLTAAAVAHSVGIGADGSPVVTGDWLATTGDVEVAALLESGAEVVFARATPEDKLRIADLLARQGEVVAMTGDGVNDAPALRRADIGVAMGEGGTDVAREAATMVLTHDDFAAIVLAVEAGRRVYDNVRKFILYIFAHAIPEVVPFLLFALTGGAIPLPLTVLQILAIDLGTETLPALALGREPAEPGLMDRPPRRRGENVVSRRMLLRAWGILGPVSALLTLLPFFSVLWRAGWTPGADVDAGSRLHHAYLQATTASFAAIVACQVGTAFAARTDRVSLRSVGLWTNPLLLAGIVFELAFAAALIYVPPLQSLFGTAALDPLTVALLLPLPVVVWAADEIFRWAGRRRAAGRSPAA